MRKTTTIRNIILTLICLFVAFVGLFVAYRILEKSDSTDNVTTIVVDANLQQKLDVVKENLELAKNNLKEVKDTETLSVRNNEAFSQFAEARTNYYKILSDVIEAYEGDNSKFNNTKKEFYEAKSRFNDATNSYNKIWNSYGSVTAVGSEEEKEMLSAYDEYCKVCDRCYAVISSGV